MRAMPPSIAADPARQQQSNKKVNNKAIDLVSIGSKLTKETRKKEERSLKQQQVFQT